MIIDGVANDGDVISLILDWARRGLLTITDTETDLILTKKNDLEEKHRRFEAVMFKKLFKDGDEVNISKLSGKRISFRPLDSKALLPISSRLSGRSIFFKDPHP